MSKAEYCLLKSIEIAQKMSYSVINQLSVYDDKTLHHKHSQPTQDGSTNISVNMAAVTHF